MKKFCANSFPIFKALLYNVGMNMSEVLNKISNIFYPEHIKCLACGDELDEETDFCKKCLKSLPFNNENICDVCGTKIPGVGVCPICSGKKHVFEIARAPFLYTGEIKRLIHNFKYNNARYLFAPLSLYMLEEYKTWKMNADMIVPVPLYAKRYKQRGYNQAEELAKELSRHLNIPVVNAVSKERETVSQTELEFKDRQENVKDAFKLIDKSVKNKNILLIDDVYTTGATVKEVCRVLNKAKVNKIYVLTLAHTEKNDKEDV